MKWFLLCLGTLPLCAAELPGVHTVYMLSMANGMDQYLANRLTNQHVVQVVTDPQRADAVFTDRIGEALQDRLDDLYPPPEEKEPPKPKDAKDKDADKDKDKDKDASAQTPSFETVNKLPKVGSLNSFGRAKGTIFLVDVKSRQVLWSVYEIPKDVSSRQLDRTAVHIVEKLKQDLAGKPAQP